MKKYTEFINEKRSHKLTVKDSQELSDFLNHVLENMENEPNLLRAAYARIRKTLHEIKQGNYTKSALPFLFNDIYHFIEGGRNMHELRMWAEKLMGIDIENYEILLTIIHEYNHILNKLKGKEIEYGKMFNIKSWAFEKEGIEPIGESKSYEDYCDFGSNYISTYLEENPDIDEDEFSEYVTQYNKADRDMGELQDISKEEIERLGKEFKNKSKIESIKEDYNARFFGLNDVPEVFKIMGFDDKSAQIMKKIAIRAFKNKGDRGFMDFFKETTGHEIFNVSKGKYSFEPTTGGGYNESKK